MVTDLLTPLLPWSRALQRLFAVRTDLRARTVERLGQPVNVAELAAALPLSLDEAELKPALRQLRREVFAWLAARDLAGRADLAEVTTAMSTLADVVLQRALQVLMQDMLARFGQPRNAAGEAQQLIIVAMGKLGGGELNVSSDIDLIFLYPEDGQTDGTGTGGKILDNFEFFSRLGRKLINVIDEITADGQVFRVDMRLRPHGDSGPLVAGFDMLENYFVSQGREWERYAWIKARPLPPLIAAAPLAAAADDAIDAGTAQSARWLEALEDLRRPFVFRKYLDFGSIEAMRALHAQIRREVAKKEMADNIKLGRGGIREIEFIAQVFQLIRGGRDERLRTRPTLDVLALLASRRQLTLATVDELSAAYQFLRRLEHRLQYLDDAQTHRLPGQPEDQALIAASMGYADYAGLQAEIDRQRALVAAHFDAVFADPHQDRPASSSAWTQDAAAAPREDLMLRLKASGYVDAERLAARLDGVRSSNRYQQMAETTRGRFDALLPLAIEVCTTTKAPDDALARMFDLLETISRRSAYLALLLQYPQALQKLAQLLAASSWAADYLQTHPILLDELLDPGLLDSRPDLSVLSAELEQSLAAAEPDTEQQMNILREAHHSQVFRLLVQDIDGRLSVESLADHLSALADLMLEKALQYAWRKIGKRHRDTPCFAVISYGKLGGKELGYASDLDLIFLMDDAAPAAAENYARLASRLNTWLSSQTASGSLFETDLRLRPNGDAGLLVSSLAAYRQYQLEAAWPWEHQALTRARFSAGDAAIGAEFERIREQILCQPRDLAHLRSEVLKMRGRMLDAHATPTARAATEFDLKQDPGGLIDVEFIVQYLVLGYAHKYAQLTGNLGNIALLKMAAELGLIPLPLAEDVRSAYRHYRRLQHAARLNSSQPKASPASLSEQIAAVRALWQYVFAAAEPSPEASATPQAAR